MLQCYFIKYKCVGETNNATQQLVQSCAVLMMLDVIQLVVNDSPLCESHSCFTFSEQMVQYTS